VKTAVGGALLLVLGGQVAQPPTIRTGINLVEVDAVVVDDKGVPVRGLQQQDFQIEEDGRPVEIASFAAVDLPMASPDAAIPAPDVSGSAAGSNAQPEDGRVMLVIFDDYHVSFDAGRAAVSRAAVKRMIERMGPSDLAAVMATSGRSFMQAEFTSDKARLLQAVEKFFPDSEVPAQGIAEVSRPRAGGASFGFVQEIKARWASDAMANAAKALAEIPNRRKAVLLVSQGIPLSLEQIIANPYASGAWQGLRDFIVTAQRSNVAVYPVDPCGLSRDAGCSRDTQDHLRSIAEGTGGFAVLNTNAPELGVERMVAESGTYYLLGYYSPAPPNDGKRHRIKVRVNRDDVKVRAREGYFAARHAPTSRPALPLDALISAPIQTRGLPMHVAAIPVPLAGRPGSAIALSIELAADDVARAGDVAFAAIAVDVDGRVRARQNFTSGFRAAAGDSPRVARIAGRLDVPAGRYQVRVAAAAKAMQGSVFTEVEVPPFDKPISLGGLALTTSAPTPEASAERLGGVLPSIPIAARRIVASASLTAVVPLKTSRKVAGEIAIRTRLIDSSGQITELNRTTAQTAESLGGAGIVYRVPLDGAIAPGTYRLAVTATAGKHEASRELTFTVVLPGARE
jgi:VWFA-related protein